jgi:hypothetical protein
MTLPIEPVTLGVEQISELHQRLSTLRHDVNNKLSLVAATVELVRRRPENTERLLNSLGEQPGMIAEIIARFSADLESALRITRP